MPTTIRPEISLKNKYWICKHRYYELKHFCLQYPKWKKEYRMYANTTVSASSFNRIDMNASPSDPTAKRALIMAHYSKRIELIEKTAVTTDGDLYLYILKAVTEGLSYTYLKTKLDIPCSRDKYYTLYRRFFWLLCDSRR